MKLRLIAAYLILTGAVTLAPPLLLDAWAGYMTAKGGAVLPLPPEDEPAEAVGGDQNESMPTDKDTAEEEPAEQPLAGGESSSGAIDGQTGASAKPASNEEHGTPVPTALQVPAVGETRVAPAPVPAEGSWWGSLMYKLGLGSDPHPGETVQTGVESAAPTPEYVIGPGDQIGISVWRDENLSRTVVVLPDGKISFPLVGEIVAGGKTVAQLKKELETKLSRYIADTGVTVEVKQSNSMIIYVIGRVNAPGRQMLLARTDVLQALAMVGGPNPFADKSDIKIFRKEDGKTLMFPFNYDDVSEGRHLETNIELKRGDVIIVP